MKKIFSVSLAMVVLTLCVGCMCEHEWEDAMCASPRTCSLCGETDGKRKVAAHEWEDVEGTNLQICSVCHIAEEKPYSHQVTLDENDGQSDEQSNDGGVIQIEDVWYEFNENHSHYEVYLVIRNTSGGALTEVLPSIDIIDENGDIVESTAAGFYNVLDDGQACTISSDRVEALEAPYGIRVSRLFISDLNENLEQVYLSPAFTLTNLPSEQGGDESTDSAKEVQPEVDSKEDVTGVVESAYKSVIDAVDSAYEDMDLFDILSDDEVIDYDYAYGEVYDESQQILLLCSEDDGLVEGDAAVYAEHLFGKTDITNQEARDKATDVLRFIVSTDEDKLSPLMKKFQNMESVSGVIQTDSVDIVVEDMAAFVEEFGLSPQATGEVLAVLDMYDYTWMEPNADKLLQFSEYGFSFTWTAVTEFVLELN